MTETIIKRDGRKAAFEPEKIRKSISRAFHDSDHTPGETDIAQLTDAVTDAEADEQRSSDLADRIRADFDDASGGHALAAVWAFMIFLLAYTPCVATLAAQKREIGLKWTMFGLASQLVGAWVLAVAAFQILRLFL